MQTDIQMVTARNRPPGKIRIVSGKWRGRKIPVAGVKGLRPTPARARETLFNWLQGRLAGASCLDLFAGTGILGLEALSRGAGSVAAVEQNPQLVQALRGIASELKADNFEIICADGMNWIRHCGRQFDLVFLDPPFSTDMASRARDALIECQVLKPGALVYVESEQEIRTNNPGFEILKQSSAGRVQYMLLALKANDGL